MDTPHSKLSLLLIFLTVAITCVTSDTFFIRLPSTDQPCPGEFTGELCLTLQEYISGEHLSGGTLPSQVILDFQPGTHSIQTNRLTASGIDSFEMRGENVVIRCSSRTNRFSRIQNFHVNGIIFSLCGFNFELVNTLTIEDSRFRDTRNGIIRDPVELIDVTNATIERTSFTDNNFLKITSSSVHLKRSTFSDSRTFRLTRFSRNCAGGAIACMCII